jgi:hypothetical protein
MPPRANSLAILADKLCKSDGKGLRAVMHTTDV